MPIGSQVLPVSLPELRAVRWSTDQLYASMKEAYLVARVEAGSSEWRSGRRLWRSDPGSLQLKRPGDVHRDVWLDGPITFQILTLPAPAAAEALGKGAPPPQLDSRDPRGAALHRLHDAVAAGAGRLALEVALTEALAALSELTSTSGRAGASAAHSAPVRRAVELLRQRLAEAVTLDELAAHAGLDKFHLCRAFRAQVGMPPYAYLTQLRILRAKELLAAGVKPSHVATQIGLYDQSQLNRHFRRIVGTTPGAYARRA